MEVDIMRSAVIILLATICAACAVRTSASSVSYSKQVVLSVPVNVVYVNLNDRSVKVTVAISKSGRGSSESAASIIGRTKPVAAITGTFFDTVSLLPTGDIVIGGIDAHEGCVGPALCITSDNRAQIIPDKFRARRANGNYETVIAGGPTLVDAGKPSLNPRAEGFSDPALFRLAQRTAIGITGANKLLLVSVNRSVSMHKMARIMVKLEAAQAILLDGGSSTALYANGHLISRPGRRLTNLLLVYESPDDYEGAAGQLAPTLITAEQLIASTHRLQTDSSSEVTSAWYKDLLGSTTVDNLLYPLAPGFEHPDFSISRLLSAR
jgi:hypothetical protein